MRAASVELDDPQQDVDGPVLAPGTLAREVTRGESVTRRGPGGADRTTALVVIAGPRGADGGRDPDRRRAGVRAPVSSR